MKSNNKYFIYVLAFIFVLFGYWIFASITEKVPAGYEGIIINHYGQQGVKDTPVITGRVFFNPMSQDLVVYPTFVQIKDYEPFQVQAKDGSTFTVDPNISYRIKHGSTPLIYEKYRKDIDGITNTIILQFTKDAFRNVINKYTTDEIVSKREEIENEITNKLREISEKDGIEIEQVTSGLQYPQSIVTAIDQKNKTVQEAQKYENEVKIAEAKAKILKTEAESKAQALLIEAEAEAKANELRKAQLNEFLIQQQFIEKWDGKLPTYGSVPQLIKSITE